MDVSEIISAQLINKTANAMKITLTNVDGNNTIEVMKSDDSSLNNFTNGDEMIFLFASPRL